MARTYDEITDHIREWLDRQAMFFVATAPLTGDGHVNLSPKGPIGSLRVLDGRRVAYLDIGGSGAETIAHLRENGRIVVMLCAFEGPPRIVRFHGRGEAILPDDSRFEELLGRGRLRRPLAARGAPIDRARRCDPGQRLLRLRRAVDELRGPARAPRARHGQEACGRLGETATPSTAGRSTRRASTGSRHFDRRAHRRPQTLYTCTKGVGPRVARVGC